MVLVSFHNYNDNLIGFHEGIWGYVRQSFVDLQQGDNIMKLNNHMRSNSLREYYIVTYRIIQFLYIIITTL